MNPYLDLVAEIARLAREGKQYPLGGFPAPARPAPAADAPRVLIFSPHPDDECIIGALALRLQNEAGMRVLNVAVTQGSRQERQAARWQELRAACDYLGFGLIATAPSGLEHINLRSRTDAPAEWQSSVSTIAGILQDEQPSVVLFPHDTDWNSTHVGTHHLLMDALAQQRPEFAVTVVETEFWGAMASPNLMVESTVEDVTAMITALSFHVGEVQRNPYHLLVPPWMQDNVRRGGELVGGQGGPAPDFSFCTLYRLRRWSGRQLHALYEGGRVVPASVNAADALAAAWRA
jgi:LmbE family N-acetylglucosaminyl deacetylase